MNKNLINLDLLKKLCATHSVSGDTKEIINYLKNYLQSKNIKSLETDFGLLVFGNLNNPKIMISAHVDEVGFQIVKKNVNSTFLVNKSGHLDPVMLNNQSVYVKTKKGIINGAFYPQKELGDNNPTNFTELFLDTLDNNSVSIGDFGSYTRYFNYSNDKLIATGLDNKISVELILELIEEKPELLNTTLFTFVTEEETTYDCIAGLSTLYKPEYAIVVDMLPSNQVSPTKAESIPNINDGPAVAMAFSSYHLHPKLKDKLELVKTDFQKAYLDIPFPPEPQAMQRNGITKGINVLIPMYGWHNSTYSMYFQDYIKTKKFIFNLHEVLLKD